MSQTTHPEASSTSTKAPSGAHHENDDREYLTFRLGEEEYGVDILKVQEIRSYDTVTKLPDAPEYIKGVINLRGTIVPIVDMRLRFRMAAANYDEFTVMIMISVEDRIVGLVVDGVSDVITLDDEHIRPPPEISAGSLDTRFITGLGAIDDHLLILVDIDQLVGREGLALTDHAGTSQSTH